MLVKLVFFEQIPQGVGLGVLQDGVDLVLNSRRLPMEPCFLRCNPSISRRIAFEWHATEVEVACLLQDDGRGLGIQLGTLHVRHEDGALLPRQASSVVFSVMMMGSMGKDMKSCRRGRS